MAKSKRKKVESIRNLVSELPKRDVAEKMKIKKDGTSDGTVIIGDKPPNQNAQNSVSVNLKANNLFCSIIHTTFFEPKQCDTIVNSLIEELWMSGETIGGGVNKKVRNVEQQVMPIDQQGWPLTRILDLAKLYVQVLPARRPDGCPKHMGNLQWEESPGSTETRCRVTPGGGDPRESATESKPPTLRPLGWCGQG